MEKKYECFHPCCKKFGVFHVSLARACGVHLTYVMDKMGTFCFWAEGQ
jgi:hypothetical protein